MLYISEKNNKISIVLEGRFQENEEELFLNTLTEDKKIEILFADVKYLKSPIVKALLRYKKNLSIESTQKSLWNYLHVLGINNRYTNIVSMNDSTLVQRPQYVAIGGSAGSLPHITNIIERLPFVDITVFICIHLDPDKKSLLQSILQKVTHYEVYEALDMQEIKKNSIYIAPPNLHLTVLNNHISLQQTERVSFSRPSVSVMFESLATAYKKTLLAIILSGHGDDGASSLKTLSKVKSKVIIQDPNECEAQDMPIHAIITKKYNHIFRVQKIIDYIDILLGTRIDYRDELQIFLHQLYQFYGHDFRNYNPKSLQRRIDAMMKVFKIRNFKDFTLLILESDEARNQLLKEFSINVTSFFRNPAVYKSMGENLLQELETYPSIRIWCAGCSRGDEAYSIAIMLDEAGLLDKTQIYATDFNATILKEAKNALFSKKEYLKSEENYLQSGGKKDFKTWFSIEDDYVEVKENIRKKILFFHHNLATDDSINSFNLILCRNVIIYFNEQLKRKIFELFDNSLERNSFLVLGNSEQIDTRLQYQSIDKKKFRIYKK